MNHYNSHYNTSDYKIELPIYYNSSRQQYKYKLHKPPTNINYIPISMFYVIYF